MITMDDKNIRKFEKDLKTFAARAYPFATKSTVNSSAFMARGLMQDQIHDTMVERNQFTQRSVRVEQAKTLNVDRQAAVVGSVAPYMDDQEFGGGTSHTGRFQAVIPTSWSSGQEGQRPRTRLPRRVNKLRNIKLGKSKRPRTRRQTAFLLGLFAAQAGERYVFIPGGTGASAGLYRVWGRRRRKGRPTRIKLKMVYSFRKNPARIPRNPTLGIAVERTKPMIPQLYLDALQFQRKRLNLF